MVWLFVPNGLWRHTAARRLPTTRAARTSAIARTEIDKCFTMRTPLEEKVSPLVGDEQENGIAILRSLSGPCRKTLRVGANKT